MSDPYWSNVVLAMHMDGANNSTTFTELKGKTALTSGIVNLTTARFKFGTASLQVRKDINGSISFANSADFKFGASSLFTLEFYLYVESGYLTNKTFLGKHVYNSTKAWAIRTGTSNNLTFSVGSSDGYGGSVFSHIITSPSGSLVSGQWQHIVVQRKNTSADGIEMFIDGVLSGSSTSNPDLDAHSPNGNLWIGREDQMIASPIEGGFDDLRITKGVTRYTEPFTPPTLAFPDSGVTTNSSSMFLVF